MNDRQVRIAILNVGDGEDESGRMTEALEVVQDQLAAGPFQEIGYIASSSEQALLRAKLRVWSETDNGAADVILTCGGVGPALFDRMPDATAEVIDRRLTGIPDLIRLACVRQDPGVAFLRLEAGVRRKTLIINLPGDASNLRLCLPHLLPQLAEVVSQLQVGPDL